SSPSDDLAEARRRVAGRRPPSGPATTPRSPGSRARPPPRWNHIQQAPGGTEPAGSGQQLSLRMRPATPAKQPRVTASHDGTLLLAVLVAGAPSVAGGCRSVTRSRGPPGAC